MGFLLIQWRVVNLLFLQLGMKLHFLALFDPGRVHAHVQAFLKATGLAKGTSGRRNKAVAHIVTGCMKGTNLVDLSSKKHTAG